MKGALTRFLRENKFDVICLQEAVWSKEAPEFLGHFVDTVDELKKVAGLDLRRVYRTGELASLVIWRRWSKEM